ncbi:peptidyl-prolyl cis-trans isomerase [bacterium]|nr:peptidyl-prolyl cis-trans isomerase [bacterium]
MNLKHILLLVLLTAGLIGCGKTAKDQENVLVQTGSETLTREEVEIIAGAPYDSLTNEERWSVINRWIGSAVLLQEGRRRGLDDDPMILSRLNEIKAELYLSKLLYEMEDTSPSDSAVRAYYDEHISEFTQTSDSYLLELYRADDCSSLASFIAEFKPEQESGTGAAVLEQSWLARTDQMNGFLQTLLVGLNPGDWTEVQSDPDGCRALRVVSTYLAGETLDLKGAREEIEMQLMTDSNHRQRDELMSELRRRFPVKVLVEE